MGKSFQVGSPWRKRVPVTNLRVWSLLSALRTKGESASVAPNAGSHVRNPVWDVSVAASAHDVLKRAEVRRSRTVDILSCCGIRHPRHGERRTVVVTSSSYEWGDRCCCRPSRDLPRSRSRHQQAVGEIGKGPDLCHECVGEAQEGAPRTQGPH